MFCKSECAWRPLYGWLVPALLLFFAAKTYAQDITVRFDGVSVEQALEQLKNEDGLSFVFKTSDVDLEARVDAEFESAPLLSVLEVIFKGQPVGFEINGKMVRISRIKTGKTPDRQANTVVKGKITDFSGDPVMGAGVLVRGSHIGTVSDMDGNYSIEVSAGDTLSFSSLGYESVDIVVGKSSGIDVVLNEQLNGLDEVVVIGYGEMKKSDLTGAVASVKPGDLPMSSNTSIAHMLSGRAAGVSAVQTSAQPGGGVEILVRGAASTGAGNEPLYIIDGFPVSSSGVEPASDNRYSDFGSRNPLNSLNPNDIASIEILKDASSTAIYGARAANGVIIITTKKGREGRPVVSYSANYGIQQIANRIVMMNASDFMAEMVL